ncbi:hypothetical protein SAMN05720766_10451 [Fibrobacter sp. UWH9]|nr:hypothetical protein SAMN05720766_10451 [Fibrobacter sp. UWH9]
MSLRVRMVSVLIVRWDMFAVSRRMGKRAIYGPLKEENLDEAIRFVKDVYGKILSGKADDEWRGIFFDSLKVQLKRDSFKGRNLTPESREEISKELEYVVAGQGMDDASSG